MTRKCLVDGCSTPLVARGWCNKHYQAWKAHGDPLASKPKRRDGDGCRRHDGYIIFQNEGVKTLEHVAICEKAIGRRLPPSAVVHHVDEDPSNNSPTNLVVCPDQNYHMLLHRRARALDECGHADWRKCWICKQYDSPENLAFNGISKIYHRACDAKRARDARAKLKHQPEGD